MTGRRPVRVDPLFFEMLDGLLGAERGPGGEPSVHDFLVIDLPEVIDLFATRFDDLIGFIDGRDDYRAAVVSGLTVPRIMVTGHLDQDGAITLMSVRLDLEAGW